MGLDKIKKTPCGFAFVEYYVSLEIWCILLFIWSFLI